MEFAVFQKIGVRSSLKNKKMKLYPEGDVSFYMNTINTIKIIRLLIVVILCGAMPASAQSTSGSSPAPSSQGEGGKLQQKLEAMTPQERQTFLENHPEIRKRIEQRRQEMLGRYAQMSPSEQQQFLQNHPQMAQFIQNHPKAVANAEANASEAKPSVNDPNHPRVNEVNQREENQQQRIAQGDSAGTLTPGQTNRIENKENKIQSQETTDMDKHDGHLTRREDHQLNREENHVSRRIYDDKH